MSREAEVALEAIVNVVQYQFQRYSAWLAAPHCKGDVALHTKFTETPKQLGDQVVISRGTPPIQGVDCLRRVRTGSLEGSYLVKLLRFMHF